MSGPLPVRTSEKRLRRDHRVGLPGRGSLGQIQPVWGLGLAGSLQVMGCFFGLGWDLDMARRWIEMAFVRRNGLDESVK